MEIALDRTNPLVSVIEARLGPLVPATGAQWEGGKLRVEEFVLSDHPPYDFRCFMDDPSDSAQCYGVVVVDFEPPTLSVYCGLIVPKIAVTGEDAASADPAIAEAADALREYFEKGGCGYEVMALQAAYLPRHGVIYKKDVDAVQRSLGVGPHHPENVQV